MIVFAIAGILICIAVILVVTVHILGLIGIGEGTPWTITPKDRREGR